MKLTIATDPEEVRAHYEREGTLLAFEIPLSIGPSGLRQLAHAHAPLPQRNCVLDLVIAHPRCDATTLEQVVELADGDPAVLSSIATSNKASLELLRVLARSSSVCVREHAEFALLHRQLSEADDDGIAQVYQEHRDHPSWGYGLRYRLVIDPRTPRRVLDSIASYRDPVAAQAQRRLGLDATGC